jgi:hypothetical protein
MILSPYDQPFILSLKLKKKIELYINRRRELFFFKKKLSVYKKNTLQARQITSSLASQIKGSWSS